MARTFNRVVCNLCGQREATALGGMMCAVCWRKQAIANMPDAQRGYEVSQIVPKLFAAARMEHLKPKLAACLTGDVTTGVLLWGPPGSGKSYAMAAHARECILAGYIVRRIPYELLCLQLRDTFKPKSVATEWSVIEALVNCDMLFMEDVGATKAVGNAESDFSVRTLQVLLDTRLEYCKPTFITSNKSLENITDSFDERVGSRLKTFHIFRMADEDKRGL
jgi:DNA replication protein DnaC